MSAYNFDAPDAFDREAMVECLTALTVCLLQSILLSTEGYALCGHFRVLTQASLTYECNAGVCWRISGQATC